MPGASLTLSSYWRSSSAWRVRIGLHLKGLPFTYRAVNLLGGEQFAPRHLARSPFGMVPVLEVEEAGARHVLTQSVAILEWLDERFPVPPLLPADTWGRARVRALVEHVNSAIQPLHNASVQAWLEGQLPGLKRAWCEHWIGRGLAALEQAAADGAGRFLHGDAVTLADVYLVPQLYAARRFGGVDLAACPTLLRVEGACAELPAFRAAAPEAQPDAPAQGPR